MYWLVDVVKWFAGICGGESTVAERIDHRLFEQDAVLVRCSSKSYRTYSFGRNQSSGELLNPIFFLTVTSLLYWLSNLFIAILNIWILVELMNCSCLRDKLKKTALRTNFFKTERFLSYPIWSCLILSDLVWSCPILSYPVLSCPILSYPVLS